MSVERMSKEKEGVQMLFFIYYIMPPSLRTCRISPLGNVWDDALEACAEP